MCTLPNLKNEDPTLLKITTKDDEIKELKYKTKKHGHENIVNLLKLTINIIKKSINH